MEKNDSCDGCTGCILSQQLGKKPTDFKDLEGTWKEALVIAGVVIQIETNGCQSYNKDIGE